MKLWVLFFVALLYVNLVRGTIYRLNASEYSRMPALYELDDYELCMEQERAVYCVVKVNLHADPGNQLMNMIREYSNDKHRHYNHSHVDRGVCVRSTCHRHATGRNLNDNAHLDDTLQQCVNDSFYKTHGLHATLVQKSCDRSDETDDISFNDRAFLAACGCLLLAVLMATLYDRGQGNPYILSFSVKQNWKWLLYSEPEDQRVTNLQGLHGVRFVLNFLMISVHVGQFYTGAFNKQTHQVERMFDGGAGYLVVNGLAIITIFFFMSGFLLTYYLMIFSETLNITLKAVPLVMVKRLMRLSPSLVMALWFSATWLRRLGSGPLWRLSVVDTAVADCRRYWWTHLLYINNYFPDNKFCLIQTWYLSADTQVFIVGLVVLLATMKFGRRRALLTLLVLGTLTPALQIWWSGINPTVVLTPEFFRSMIGDSFFYYHMVGHNNLQNYVIGMATGILVYKYQQKGKDLANNKWYARSHLLTIPAYAYFFYVGHVFYSDVDPSLWTRVLYAATQRLVAAALNVWLLLGFVLNSPAVLCRMSRCRAWVVTSRLTYGVYLLHMNVIYIGVGSNHHVQETTAFKLFLLYLGVALFSYVLAFFFYLLVEAPFTSLAKVVTSSLKTKNDTTLKGTRGNGAFSNGKQDKLHETLSGNGTAISNGKHKHD